MKLRRTLAAPRSQRILDRVEPNRQPLTEKEVGIIRTARDNGTLAPNDYAALQCPAESGMEADTY